jgi:hypothetical protein
MNRSHFSFFVFLLLLLPLHVFAGCNLAIEASTPSTDFTVNNDGTVSHKKTGLMWKVCSEGQVWSNGSCTGVKVYNWQQALQLPMTLNSSGGYAGYSDWRLPNIKELQSISEQQCSAPGINSSIFPSINDGSYWSSSPVAHDSSSAWSVNLFMRNSGAGSANTIMHNRTTTFSTLLVRGGQ